MKILFTGINSGNSADLSQRIGISKLAQSFGHEVCVDLGDEPDIVICVDYLPRYNRVLRRAKKMGLPLVLIKHEPPAVLPQQAKENPGQLFDKVITKGSTKENPPFNCLLFWDSTHLNQAIRKERVVSVSSDKWSFGQSEMYSLRRHLYSRDPRIDLYGYGWGRSNSERALGLLKSFVFSVIAGQWPKISNLRYAFKKPLNYLGPVIDKHEIISRYNVALVIENDMFGMSEKLVDCILAGTIPVYVGPKLLDFGVPEELVVQSDPDSNKILESIDFALRWDSGDFRRRAGIWANLPSTKETWEPIQVNRRLLREVADWYESRS